MPYCRKCGAKLDENARFCHVCGTPVAPVAATPLAAPRRRRLAYLLPVVILIAVLLVAVVISVLIFLPVNSVHFNQSPLTKADVGSLLMDFQADVANVNVIFENLPCSMVILNVTAEGSFTPFRVP